MRRLTVVIPLFFLLFSCSKQHSIDMGLDSKGVQGVRFDPSYYYNLKTSVHAFADSVTTFWHDHGINTVFFKAYDPKFGAVYKTSYRFNKTTDYSNADLLKIFIESCHKNNIQLIIWVPVLEHKGAWDANPDWRIKKADGTDLIPEANNTILCYNNPQVRSWWFGFIKDIISRYPQLDGIDIAEPSAVWKKNNVCQCTNCKSTEAPFSPAGIEKRSIEYTDFLDETFKIIKSANIKSCLTLTITADRQSRLLPFDQQKKLTGINLDKLFSSENKPEWFSCEVLWQQWADLYDDPLHFNPEWTKNAIAQCFQMINSRTHCISHVELTSLGPVSVTPQELATSIISSRNGGMESVEFYDTHLADSMNAWDEIAAAWRTHPQQTVYLYHDQSGLGVTRQIATLFGHFNFDAKVIDVDSFSNSAAQPEFVVYVGTDEHNLLPDAFKAFACTTKTNFFWINQNIDKISKLDSIRGFRFVKTLQGNIYNKVMYKDKLLQKKDSIFTVIDTLAASQVKIHAWALNNEGDKKPYIIQSGNFWYVSDCPVDYMVEGGRNIAFADLLHEFTHQDHPEHHTALVRIEDICVLSNPKQITKIADYLHSENVPFSLAVVPFYVDPEENTVLSLSDRPALVRALKYAVSKGGSIVMHGSTHQYRGLTTADYEFWDELKNAPIFEDSKEYVRIRLERGLAEFRKNGLYPVIWETPHYGASQLDYQVINEYFSSEYGRRQVIDKKGFDQLVPYFISKNMEGISIIPENLGYIPSDHQEAAPLLVSSDHNLAVRDGFASFFFHPWINLEVLKDLVSGIRKQGYIFADIKNTDMEVRAKDFVHITGKRSISEDVEKKFIRTMFIDKNGKFQNNRCSGTPSKGQYNQNVICPSGSIFIFDKLDHAPTIWDNFPKNDFALLNKAESWFFETKTLKLKNSDPIKALILWDKDSVNLSRLAWRTLLSYSGIDADTMSVDLFVDVPPTCNLLFVPEYAAKELSVQQSLVIAQWVSKGNKIVLEKNSSLAAQLGIHVTDTLQKTTALKDDYYSNIPVSLPDTMHYCRFTTDVENVVQYSTEKDSPLVVSGEYGDGEYLFFGTEVSKDPQGADSRFPFLLDLIERQFSLYPVLRSPNLEVYYDPGTRENVSLEDLVKMWKKSGVRIVHISGWEDYPDYTFEYKYFTNLLHQSGMLAYAWFDLPHISERFYLAHPEWREINDKGKNAVIGWRKLMNLTNDTCRAGAFNSIKKILMAGSWDGVNITGKMFEGASVADTGKITPFNQSFRTYYKSTYGYDPLLIVQKNSLFDGQLHPQYWNQFCSVRDSIEQAILIQFIGSVSRQLNTNDTKKEIIVTRPYLDITSESQQYYANMQNSYPFVKLQLSLNKHTLGVKSFDRLTAQMAVLFKNWKPVVEIDLDNITPESKTTHQLCGTELQGIISQAVQNGVRFTLKTESSIYDVDFKDLSYSTAATCKEKYNENTWEFTTPEKTEVEFDNSAVKKLIIDNFVWPAYSKGRAILPAGHHVLSNSPLYRALMPTLNNTTILGFGGTFNNAMTTFRGVEFNYNSAQVAPLALSVKPKEIYLDGAPFKDNNNSVHNETILFPAGNHNVVIRINTIWDAIAAGASIGLSSTIVVGSTVVIIVFVILYISSTISRKRRITQLKKKSKHVS